MVVEEHMQKYSNIFGGDVPYDLGQDMKWYACSEKCPKVLK